MSKHVAVLMGGWSAEREISLRSGKACAEALARRGHRVTRIDVGRDIAAVLTTVKPDVALNMLHGRPGEDGTLPWEELARCDAVYFVSGNVAALRLVEFQYAPVEQRQAEGQ